MWDMNYIAFLNKCSKYNSHNEMATEVCVADSKTLNE